MSEKETDALYDAVVAKIKEPIQEFEEVLAELLMAHAYFEVVTTLAVYQGKGTKDEIKDRILGSLDAFLEGNPLPYAKAKTH